MVRLLKAPFYGQQTTYNVSYYKHIY